MRKESASFSKCTYIALCYQGRGISKLLLNILILLRFFIASIKSLALYLSSCDIWVCHILCCLTLEVQMLAKLTFLKKIHRTWKRGKISL